MAKFDKTSNTLDRFKDQIYEVPQRDGTVRLIKFKSVEEGYVELNLNDGSELGKISGDEMAAMGGTNIPPLTTSEKTSYLEKFDASTSTGSGDSNITITGGRGKTDMFPGMGGAGFGGSTPDNTYLDSDQTTLEEITSDTAMNKRLAPAYARGARQRATNELNPNEYDIVGKELDPKYAGESISMAEFKTQQAVDAGRRPIAENAPPEYLPPLEQTNISLPPSEKYTGGISELADKGGAPGVYNPVGGPLSAMAPDLDERNLVIGTGGDRGLFEVDDDFYKSKDGTLMKDAGWWGDDTKATQADIDAGITDQNSSSPWGSTEGWKSAGAVMKGVGGLASAYTGIKNYQLARDAHNTQKNQWQANYDQRLKAYGANKKLANEEIRRKNRTLKARGQAESYQTI